MRQCLDSNVLLRAGEVSGRPSSAPAAAAPCWKPAPQLQRLCRRPGSLPCADGATIRGATQIVAGVMSKWVNLGKGWRPRLFVLKDGVLRYYRVPLPPTHPLSFLPCLPDA